MKVIKHGVYGQRLSCRTCGSIFEVEGKEDIHRYANGFLFSGDHRAVPGVRLGGSVVAATEDGRQRRRRAGGCVSCEARRRMTA